MTDPLAPFDSGSDPLAPPPAAPVTPSPAPPSHPKSPAAPEPGLSEPADSASPRAERPGTSRPDGPPPRPGASAHEANVVDLPPLPRRSLFYRLVSFSWELTLGVSLVLLILISGGVFYVVDLVKSVGPTYIATEFYDEKRFEIVVEDGDRVVYDTYLDKVGAWDHRDCSGVAAESSIQQDIEAAGCESGIEAAYDRQDLGYTVYQRVLEFGDAASAAEAKTALGDEDGLGAKLTFTESYPDEAEYGAVADAEDRFLIVTVIAVEPAGEKNLDEAEAAIDTFHTSNLNFLVMDTL